MAILDYNGIKAKINSGEKSPLYVLHGEDQYLLHETEKSILQQLTDGKEESGDAIVWLDKNAALEEIEQALLQTGFFADYSIVVVKDSYFFTESLKTKSEKAMDIVALLCNIPENAYLLFVNGKKLDKRLSVYKVAEKQGFVVEINKLRSTRDIATWLGKKLQEKKMKMDMQAREYFIEVFSVQECSAGMLEQEWDKLFLYAMHKKVIRQEDLQAVDIGQIGALVFKASDAIWGKDLAKAMLLLEKYFFCGGSLQAFVALLAKQMLQVLEVQEKIRGEEWNTGGLSYVQKKQAEQSRVFAADTLKQSVCFLSALDTKSKNGVLTQGQGRIALETFVVELLC